MKINGETWEPRALKRNLEARVERLEADLSRIVREFEEETGLTVRIIEREPLEPLVYVGVRMGLLGLRGCADVTKLAAEYRELASKCNAVVVEQQRHHEAARPFANTPGALEP